MAKEKIFKVNEGSNIFYFVDLERICALEIEKDDNGSYDYVVGFMENGRTIEVGKDQADDFVKAWLEIKR